MIIEKLSKHRDTYRLASELEKRGAVYLEQLVEEGWNRVTLTATVRVLEELKLVRYELEFTGNMGTRKWYSLTPKGKHVLKLITEAEKVIRDS